MENKNLEESIDALNKALEAGENVVSAPVLNVKDESDVAKKYLTSKALKALEDLPKAKKLLGCDIHGVPIAKAVYFAARIKSDKIERAIEQMALVANDLVEKGLIHSILAPISTIELFRMPGEVATSAAFFFPLVPIDKVNEIKKYDFSTEEGEVGKLMESSEIEQKPGDFYAVERVTAMFSMMQKDFDEKKHIEERVEFYLKVLPSGTKFLGYTKCGILDLCIPYELKFSNPLLQRVKRVELDFVREIARLEEGEGLHEFNVFTGIRFYGEGDKELYKGFGG